jgi:hypothetical protein
LNWTHLCSLIYIEDSLKREFYLEMCCSAMRLHATVLDCITVGIIAMELDQFLYKSRSRQLAQ